MSEKTEQPTARRLDKAREQGQVAKSAEVGSTAGILLISFLFMLRWEANMQELETLFTAALDTVGRPFGQAAAEMGTSALHALVFICAPLVLGAALAGVVAHVGQVGFLFSMEAAKPNLGKINPSQWVKKVVSKKALMELAKTVAKTLLLAWILERAVLAHLDPLLKAGLRSPQQLLSVFGAILFRVMLWCGLTFLVVAALDFLFQKRMHLKEMMMTKEEVKNEYKEMDGDPHIKSRRRQLHEELANDTTLQETRKASVLVVNPTHIAVALRYEKGVTPLPLITARAEGALAARMRRAAEEAGVPVLENVPLAHDLFRQGRVSAYIPSALVEPVAEVMRWVDGLTA